MTDKQIIIDGLACVNCPEAKRCQEQRAKKEYAINQVLQDIPTEYANVIARLKQIIPSVTRCDYALEKQLKRKEQECEELKRANLHIENNREHKANKLNRIEKLILACTTGYTDEFIQELLVILHEPEPVSFENKYLQALEEIKDIADYEFKERMNAEDYHNMTEILEQILQKINECEINNEC